MTAEDPPSSPLSALHEGVVEAFWLGAKAHHPSLFKEKMANDLGYEINL